MSLSVSHSITGWSPFGFDTYRQRFPATPPLTLPPDRTAAFCAAWDDLADPVARAHGLRPLAGGVTVVFIRGYLGHYMPGNLVPARDSLRRFGFRAHLAPNSAGGAIAPNGQRLAALLDRLAPSPVILCGHSRGGLEALFALRQRPDLTRRVKALLMSQTPRGPSWVLESVLTRRHPRTTRRALAEVTQRLGLTLLGARPGGLELAREHLEPLVARLAPDTLPFPVLQTASWSSRPTTWLDSFHERLSELRPGVAHDGQFYLEDLLWPGLNHVLLPHLDHAQPVMDGFGFDSARYWQTLLWLALR